MKRKLSIVFVLLLCFIQLNAQCPQGEVEVTIHISTDSYGNEGYWQLVPFGNSCGSGTIDSGGNNTVGCNGGGQQNSPSGGYSDNTTISEGPWCVMQGDTFDIIYIDDYGDGGLVFRVDINGYPVYPALTGNGNGAGSRLTFVANPPSRFDLSCRSVELRSYNIIGSNNISARFMNLGLDTITSLDMHYSINQGPVVSASLNLLNIAPFTNQTLIHPIQWTDTATGLYTVQVWASNLNGSPDSNLVNDTASKSITLGPGIPNFIDDYIGMPPVLTVIGNSADGVSTPRDLDFHPVLTRYELWVINKSTENSGGETVKFTNAGLPGQTSLLQQDGNAWHFMSLPTGIAFSDNENFATSPGVYDANHNGGSPFTGPTLWSSDPLIYAQPSAGNGSHIDMLHQSPYSMGICHERDNVFWVYDGDGGDVVRYDFAEDHGPGASDHSDAVIRRYEGLNLQCDPSYHVSSHLVLEKESSMLYIVDTGNDRILKMDINSGAFTTNLSWYEAVQEYSRYDGAVWSIFADSALVSPSGIDLLEDRLIVSNYGTGEIIIYDIINETELGRISTGTPGIMGVKIGPDGKIWYVNSLTSEVVRIDGLTLGSASKLPAQLGLFPNPADNRLVLQLNESLSSTAELLIFNASGQIVNRSYINKGQIRHELNVGFLTPGIYAIHLVSEDLVLNNRFIKK
jgi:hypothetical protein